MRVIESLIGVVVLAGIAAAQETEGEAVRLEWKIEEGRALRYALTQVVEGDFQGTKVAVRAGFEITVKLDRVEEEGAKGTLQLDRLRYKVSGFAEEEYDSAVPAKGEEADATQKLLEELIGKKVRLKLSREGRILELEGFDRIVRDAMKKAGHPEGGVGPIVEQFLKDKRMKTILQESFGLLPEKAVKVGDTWESDSVLSVPMLGEMKLANTMELQGVSEDGGRASVGQKTRLSVRKKDKPDPDDPFGGMVQITGGKGEADWVWNLREGCPETMERKLQMKMDAGAEPIPLDVTLRLKRLR